MEMRNTYGELLKLIKDKKIEEFINEFPGGDDLTLSQMVKLKLIADNEKVTFVVNEFINKKYKVDKGE